MSTPGYPIVLRLAKQRCVVVGGGRVALRKVTSLIDAGAIVTVVAPRVDPAITALGVEIVLREYQRGDLSGCRVAITATGDHDVDGAVFADGSASGVLICAADDPAHCDFTLPAVLRKGPVTVAVSTDGVSPALASWLRDSIAGALPETLDELVALVTKARSAIRASGIPTEGLAWQTLITTLAAVLEEDPGRVQAPLDYFIAGAIARHDNAEDDRRGTVTL